MPRLSYIDSLLRRRETFGARPTGTRLQRIERSQHYSGGMFHNPAAIADRRTGSTTEVIYEQLTGWRRRRPPMPVPVRSLDPKDIADAPNSGTRVTWLGHSTVLAELGSRKVLFDPVWSERCSPFPYFGPPRQHRPPIALDDLPDIDVVAISHDHYDHLDHTAVTGLAARTSAEFVVPLGVGAHLERWGVAPSRIIELDWHETTKIAGIDVTATPARHYSQRGLGATPEIFWCSWAVTSPDGRLFHAGDTGYFPGLRDIGAEYGPFDVTMMPVGAYDDLWPDVHLTPEEAVQAHHDLGGRTMLPVHWASFPLASHPWSEPIERTVAAARIADVELLTPMPGEPIEPALWSAPDTDWWSGAADGAPAETVDATARS